jgi:hypothetical protein
MIRFISLFLLLVVTTPTLADDAVKPFVGRYEGSAVAKNRDSLYFGVGNRDMGIDISAKGDGFSVRWSTIKKGGKRKNKTTTMTFVATPQPGIYKSEKNGEPIGGKPYSWAHIRGKEMRVYIFAVRKDGGYDLSIYRRTLTSDGMRVEFRRLRDGSPVRIVIGKAARKN